VSRFQFRGRDSNGQSVQGVLEVGSIDIAAAQLSNRGITPIAIEPANDSAGSIDVNQIFGPEKVKPDDLIMLTRQMYTITKAGLPLIRGIRGLVASMRHPRLRDALDAIADDLETGMQLSTAMVRHDDVFDNLYVNMVRVGEDSGQLETVFNQLSEYLERDQETKKRIKSALRYPSFVLLALMVAMVVVNIFVIPAFANMFARFEAQLPLPTRMLIGTSNFFVEYWPYLLVLSIAAFVAFREYVKTDTGSVWWGEFKLKIPLVGSILNRAMMARYSRSFALMLQSGVPLPQALELCAKAIDNAFLAEKIRGIKSGVERGDSLLRTHNASEMFSPLVLQMIAVGEESGQVEELLKEVSGFYEREVDYDVKTLSDRIEPIMIVIMAGFVMVLALGIFLPMWEMYNIQKT